MQQIWDVGQIEKEILCEVFPLSWLVFHDNQKLENLALVLLLRELKI